MGVYLGVALVATCLSVLSRQIGQKTLRIVFDCLLIAWFCLFAGLRDYTIGTDVMIYGIPCFQAAQTMDFDTFSTAYETVTRWPIFSKLFYWIVPNITHDPFWFFFMLEAVVVSPVIIALNNNCKQYAPLGVLVFSLMFYPMSFNLMRQFMGMGFVLLAFPYAVQKRPLPFVAITIVGVLFHTSVLIALLIYPLVRLLSSERLSNGMHLISLTVLIVGIVLVAVNAPSVFVRLGIYSNYFTDTTIASQGSARVFATVLVLLVVLMVLDLLFDNRQTRMDRTELYLYSLVLIGTLLLCLSIISVYAYRIGFIYLYFIFLLVPLIASRISDKRCLLLFVIILALGLFWWSSDYYSIQGNNEVVPYRVAASVEIK